MAIAASRAILYGMNTRVDTALITAVAAAVGTHIDSAVYNHRATAATLDIRPRILYDVPI
jgi:hypothetical protein